MFGFGKNRKKRYGADSLTDGENTVSSREAELDALDMKIEETLTDIFEESRNRKYKLPKSAKIN